MKLWKIITIIEMSVGVIMTGLSPYVEPYSVYLLVIGIILFSFGIIVLGYNTYKTRKIRKLSKFILIEPKTDEVEIFEAYTPPKLGFTFRVVNMSEKKLKPKSGRVSIYHDGRFIITLNYDPDIEPDSDGVFMREIDVYTNESKKEGNIWVYLTLPELKTIYQWYLKCSFEYEIDKISIKRNISKKEGRFILSSRQRDTILKRMK